MTLGESVLKREATAVLGSDLIRSLNAGHNAASNRARLPSFWGAHPRIDVDIPERIAFEFPPHARALRTRQAVDAVALK